MCKELNRVSETSAAIAASRITHTQAANESTGEAPECPANTTERRPTVNRISFLEKQKYQTFRFLERAGVG